MLGDIITEFESSQSGLISILDGFTENNFNVIPFEGSWSAAQVTEHLLKANSGAVHTLKGKTKDTSRQPDLNEEMIRSAFLNFETKMKSPDFILPSDEPKEQEDMITKCIRTGDELRKIVTGENLSLLCTDFSLPQMGELTRYEWICFVNCHSRRHTHQLENIFNVLNK
ncbi:MAG: DinB family protein [Ignavibacteria bacterium]